MPRRPLLRRALVLAALAVSQLVTPAPGEETGMRHAKGDFEVKITLLPLGGLSEDVKLGRLAIEKTFRGALDAVGQGQMLTAEGEVEGSGIYVAAERVTGTLDGRKGSFLLHHRGVMTRGEPALSVQVVPDSGTGDLAGIRGTLHIAIEGHKHFYDLEYSLPGGE